MAVNKKSGLPLCWTLLCGGQATGGRASQMGQESTVRDNAGRPKSRLPGTGGGAVGRGGWDQVREPCEGHRHLLVGGSLRRGGRATPRKSPAGPLSPRAGAVQDGRVGGGGGGNTLPRRPPTGGRGSRNLGNLGSLLISGISGISGIFLILGISVGFPARGCQCVNDVRQVHACGGRRPAHTKSPG